MCGTVPVADRRLSEAGAGRKGRQAGRQQFGDRSPQLGPRHLSVRNRQYTELPARRVVGRAAEAGRVRHQAYTFRATYAQQ